VVVVERPLIEPATRFGCFADGTDSSLYLKEGLDLLFIQSILEFSDSVLAWTCIVAIGSSTLQARSALAVSPSLFIVMRPAEPPIPTSRLSATVPSTKTVVENGRP